MIVGSGGTLYRWMVLRSMFKLAERGINSPTFKAKRAQIIYELGLPLRAKDDVVLEAIEKKIKECESNLKPGDIKS